MSRRIYDIYGKLDYKVKDSLGRCEIVEEALREYEDKFMDHFEKRFKVHPNKEHGLSDEDNTCAFIEKLADYILAADKKEEHPSTNMRMLKRKLVKESSIQSDEEGIDESDTLTLAIEANSSNNKSNYKFDAKKELMKHHFEKEDRDIDVKVKTFILECDSNIKKLKEYKQNINDFKQKRAIDNMACELKEKMVLYKDSVLGTIYFKSLLPDKGGIEWDEIFDWQNKDHIKLALRMKPVNIDGTKDFAFLIRSVQNLVERTELTEIERNIIELRKDSLDGSALTSKELSIALNLNITTQAMDQKNDRIVKKVCDQYWKEYEQWYYLNVAKGKYKTCIKCGEIDIEERFWGHSNICKKCR